MSVVPAQARHRVPGRLRMAGVLPRFGSHADVRLTSAARAAAGCRRERPILPDGHLVAAERKSGAGQHHHLGAHVAVAKHAARRPLCGSFLLPQPHFGGIEQLKGLSVERALPARGDEVLVQRRDGPLRPAAKATRAYWK